MSQSKLFQIEPYGDVGALGDATRAANAVRFTKSGRKTAVALWVAQALLAALFVFAGVMKLVTPIDVIAKQAQLPGAFMRFIGVAETLGGLGLVLPGLLCIRRELTPLAAAGLVIIMSGATVLTVLRGQGAMALVPFVVGSVAVLVVIGRREWF